MLSELGWRSLENRRIVAWRIKFYKVTHGYVAFQRPTHFDKPLRYTRHMHTISFRQIHTASSYYQYSFSLVTSHINYIFVRCIRCSSHAMCLYQVMMTLHVLNNVAYDAESTQQLMIMS